MSERQLDAEVEDMVADLGCLMSYHTWTSVHSPSGWPDRVYARKPGHRLGGAVMFRELKRQGAKPTATQQQWLDALTAAGLDAGWWDTSDLTSGRIARELATLAGLKVAGEAR
jgi:hypothetical protein